MRSRNVPKTWTVVEGDQTVLNKRGQFGKETNVIGTGSYGVVLKNGLLCVKCIPKNLTTLTDVISEFQNGKKPLSCLVTSIALLEGRNSKGECFYGIVMPHLGPNIQEVYREKGELFLEYGRELLEAVARLHRHGLSHLDMTPRNIVVCRNGRLRFIDLDSLLHTPTFRAEYGLSENGTIVPGLSTGPAPEQYNLPRYEGDPHWDPSVLEGQPVDMWATGLVLFFMATGRYFQSEYLIYRTRYILDRYMPQPLERFRPLFEKLFAIDPKKRITATKALELFTIQQDV